MNNYRGDTFWRSYEVEYENQDYTFQEGDYIIVAFCDYSNNKYLEKKINAKDGETKIEVTWSKEEMSTLKVDDYIIEVEVTTANFRKTYQEEIKIKKDYIETKEVGDE